MIKSAKQAKDLAKEYNKITKDIDRLKFLQKNKETMKVVLDNDCSMVAFITDVETTEEEDDICSIDLNNFEDCHGWGDGNILLFEFAGITAESC